MNEELKALKRAYLVLQRAYLAMQRELNALQGEKVDRLIAEHDAQPIDAAPATAP